MFDSEEYKTICEYFEAGFTCSEISLETDIPLWKLITYLSRWLNSKVQPIHNKF